jgi:hypothetical protein
MKSIKKSLFSQLFSFTAMVFIFVSMSIHADDVVIKIDSIFLSHDTESSLMTNYPTKFKGGTNILTKLRINDNGEITAYFQYFYYTHDGNAGPFEGFKSLHLKDLEQYNQTIGQTEFLRLTPQKIQDLRTEASAKNVTFVFKSWSAITGEPNRLWISPVKKPKARAVEKVVNAVCNNHLLNL